MTDLKKKLREVNKLRLEVLKLEQDLDNEVKNYVKDKIAVLTMKRGQIDDLMKDVFVKELNIKSEKVDLLEALLLVEEKANPKKDLIL